EVITRAGTRAWLQGLRDQLNNIAAQGIHLGMEFNAAHAIAQINQRSACVFLHNGIWFLFCDFNRPHAFRDLYWFVVARLQVEVTAPRSRFGSVNVPGLLAAGE